LLEFAEGRKIVAAMNASASVSRRRFFGDLTALGAAGLAYPILGQVAGERPAAAAGVKVINPRARAPISYVIDDSTCLVNLNHFAVPQFRTAFGGGNNYTQNWREWPREIPDSFVRKFGEWCAERGVKGKWSVVPFPACVGRLDRMLPGWSREELQASIEQVRALMAPNWDIHPEMVTHTRVIDLKTGHPYEDHSTRFMENWEWTTGRSADEIAAYMAYALQILKNIGLNCEGITTPGGFGNRALPQLAQATLQSVRSVFGAEIPHYFRHAFDKGPESVAPRVEYASGLETSDPRCVVSIICCTGDWTGGWDNSTPGGADKYITADGKGGRLVEIIERGEPACMLSHWTGIFFNGQETGFKIFQEAHRRLHARYDNLHWMKLAELSRYWAAKELTRIEKNGGAIKFKAPFACPEFTIELSDKLERPPSLAGAPLEEVNGRLKLKPGTWTRDAKGTVICFALPKGESELRLS
jgi:hypothetical protein